MFGANGTIGSRIVAEALTRGHEVTAVDRNPTSVTSVTTDHDNLTVNVSDVLDATSVVSASKGRDFVVSADGGALGDGRQYPVSTSRPSAFPPPHGGPIACP